MIYHNPKEWFSALFQFNKADTFRKLLPLIIFVCLYSWLVAYLELNYFKLSENSHLKNIPQLHSLLGFAISMLLVFRTNTAYDRWWEGRKLWGSLVNNSRNLAIKLNSFLPHDDTKNRNFFKKLIPRFAIELKLHLQSESTRLALDEKLHPEIPNFDVTKHIPNQVASLIISRINMLYKEGKITDAQLISIISETQSFLDICGACERIKNTPIPYSYSSFIKKFIVIYILTMPLGFVFTLGYITIPIVAFIFYVLASLELIAEEIEEPFGKDENDLPMNRIAENIQKNVEDILA
jgi:putative membrane protein